MTSLQTCLEKGICIECGCEASPFQDFSEVRTYNKHGICPRCYNEAMEEGCDIWEQSMINSEEEYFELE